MTALPFLRGIVRIRPGQALRLNLFFGCDSAVPRTSRLLYGGERA
jgi:hypothetical protein